MSYSVIDLFAGAGGLSLGFEQAKEFKIVAFFEKNKNAVKTYRRNFPDADAYDNVQGFDYDSIEKAIDVVIGGPPCQGFSNANRQHNKAINQNNLLVREYVRAILALNPKAFVMENVSMLRSRVHFFYKTVEDESIIQKYKIPTNESALLLLEQQYADPDFYNLVQNRVEVEASLWKKKDYLLLNTIYRQRNNDEKCKNSLINHERALEKLAIKLNEMHNDGINHSVERLNKSVSHAIINYYKNNNLVETLIKRIEQAIMVQRMLNKAKEIFDNNILPERYSDHGDIVVNITSFGVKDYLENILGLPENGYIIKSTVLNAADYGAPQKRKRFILIGIKKNISEQVIFPEKKIKDGKYNTVQDAIEDLEDVDPTYEVKDKPIILKEKRHLSHLAKKLRDSELLYNHVITETKKEAMERFKKIKQGNNFHSLDKSLIENTYTDASRTQNTIYLRLKYDEPSGTVLNVRKSMWIHPMHDRALSVREAARLQTFPDSFVFKGTKDSQYQQVGNAVPPFLAKAIAKTIADLLNGKGTHK